MNSNRVNDFFILCFSLLSLPLTHLTLFFSFPFSPHPHRSTLSQSRLASSIQQSDQSFQSNIAVIPTNHENDEPGFRSASLIFDHMKTTGFLGRPWSSVPSPWLNEHQWFQWVCSIWLLMVVGGWVWVILGLCWVCSLMEKTAAGWVWVWLDGFCWRILLKGGWLCVGVAWQRRQVCEFVLEETK